MLLLSIDTCDARGSVAVHRDAVLLANELHSGSEEYSLWLARAVERAIHSAGLTLPQIDVFAVTTGPGSFTGARVGLTAVKAWSEVYRRPIVGISRMEILAQQASPTASRIASFFDGSRAQVFGALYRRESQLLSRIGDESVLSPAEFLAWVAAQAEEIPVVWSSLDSEKITAEPAWKARAAAGERVVHVAPNLAPLLGQSAYLRAQAGLFTDAAELDANYVRRTDAEVFWQERHASAPVSK